MPKIEKVNLFQHQTDAVLSQANPVSTTLYTVLDTTKNVRIINACIRITWATTQPTPLDLVFTVDEVPILFTIGNPASASDYEAAFSVPYNDSQNLVSIQAPTRAFLLEGRSIKIQVRITWATTQPTPLDCRVKYAKIP